MFGGGGALRRPRVLAQFPVPQLDYAANRAWQT